jgi:hypothetical protein
MIRRQEQHCVINAISHSLGTPHFVSDAECNKLIDATYTSIKQQDQAYSRQRSLPITSAKPIISIIQNGAIEHLRLRTHRMLTMAQVRYILSSQERIIDFIQRQELRTYLIAITYHSEAMIKDMHTHLIAVRFSRRIRDHLIYGIFEEDQDDKDEENDDNEAEITEQERRENRTNNLAIDEPIANLIDEDVDYYRPLELKQNAKYL